MPRSLRILMFVTDVGFVLYWVVTALQLIHPPGNSVATQSPSS